MTPRRYLSAAIGGLTLDNRDHYSLSESQQDEINALRAERRLAIERERILVARIDELTRQIIELQKQIDDGKESRIL